jgi:hypothetical protein
MANITTALPISKNSVILSKAKDLVFRRIITNLQESSDSVILSEPSASLRPPLGATNK